MDSDCNEVHEELFLDLVLLQLGLDELEFRDLDLDCNEVHEELSFLLFRQLMDGLEYKFLR